MRVLLVGDSYPPASGGVAAHVERLATNLAQRDHRIAVVAAAGARSRFVRNSVECVLTPLSVARIPGVFVDPSEHVVPPWPDRMLTEAIIDAANQLGAEVIHAHGWCEASAEVASRHLDLPLVVTLHDYGKACAQKSHFRSDGECRHFAALACLSCPGSDQSKPKRMLLTGSLRFNRLRRKNGRRFGSVRYLAVSNAVVDRCRVWDPEMELTVVPNFVELSSEPMAPFAPTPVVLFIGPDAPYKGVDQFREAHRRLLADGWNGKMVHVGGAGVSNEVEGYEELGRCSPQKISQLLRASWLLAAPALYPDPCPTTILEALAQGRPAIASAAGGHVEMLTSRVGRLVPIGDADALASTIIRLTSDVGALQTMGSAARDWVKRFSSTEVIPIIEEVYRAEVSSGLVGSAERLKGV